MTVLNSGRLKPTRLARRTRGPVLPLDVPSDRGRVGLWGERIWGGWLRMPKEMGR